MIKEFRKRHVSFHYIMRGQQQLIYFNIILFKICKNKINLVSEIVDEDIVSSITSRLGITGAQLQWVARHRTIQQCFGLVQDKGYTLALACNG